MPAEIPGYYFDPDKNKYFKIEKTHTAPSTATWSADSVKRRRAAADSAAVADDRAQLLRGHVRRHPGLARDWVARGLLQRELGEREEEDLRAVVWTSGVVDKGSVLLAPRASGRSAHSANMQCMYVNVDDAKTGLGVAYATPDEETLIGSYIPTDDNDTIEFSTTASPDSGRRRAIRIEGLRVPQMSSITYHAPSHQMVVTTRCPSDSHCGVHLFSPPLSDEADLQRPRWLMSHATNRYRELYASTMRPAVAHTATPAPAAASNLVCVVGTSAGVMRVHAAQCAEMISWVGELPFGAPPDNDAPRETLALDFLHNHPQVLLAGGRRSRLWLADMRAPSTTGHYVSSGSDGGGRRGSALAHLRSISEHEVLVAGPPHSMATYDTRFLRSPVVRFDGYRNEAHVQAGWDVCTELGLVAAAHDDGTVKLFSLKTGRCLPGNGGALAGLRTGTPIKALVFRKMPRERLPSLFVGEGAVMRKFSLGVGELGDEA